MCVFLIIFHKHSDEKSLQEFPVNIVVLAKGKKNSLDEQRAKKFIAILNEDFHNISGDKIFSFWLKRFATVDELESSQCKSLLDLGMQAVKPDRDTVYKVFEACADERIADHHAINVYIFLSSWDNDERRKSSRIFFHGFRPFIFMNADRLDNDWSVWPHEFGHAFGLTEVPVCGSTPEMDSNYMGNEFDFCAGTGGNRKLGFYPWQVWIMKLTAKIVENRLAI